MAEKSPEMASESKNSLEDGREPVTAPKNGAWNQIRERLQAVLAQPMTAQQYAQLRSRVEVGLRDAIKPSQSIREAFAALIAHQVIASEQIQRLIHAFSAVQYRPKPTRFYKRRHRRMAGK